MVKVPVSLTDVEKSRLDALLGAVKECISPTASRALDRSTICRATIMEMVEQFEEAPEKLAAKLGLAVSGRS